MTQSVHWIQFQESPWPEANEWAEKTPPPQRSPQRARTPQPFTAVSFDDVPDPVSALAFTREPTSQARGNWRELVPARFLRQFPALSEELFVALSDQAPLSLAKLIRKEGLLDNAELTLAAEAMGHAEDQKLVRQTLTVLLRHQSALVREGAIYGLAELGSLDVRVAMATLARIDEHPGVRRAARAVLADWTEPAE